MLSQDKFLLILSSFLFFTSSQGKFSNDVSTPSNKNDVEIWLQVEYRLTMANHDDEGAHPLYYDFDNMGFLERTPCNQYDQFNESTESVITGDGIHRYVVTFNGSVPGPTINVYQNSTLTIHVTNLIEEAVSVHWHGLNMRDANFMDGVGMVTQCPIMMGQTFTYRFKVLDPPGTYWYHGHTGVNIGDGLYGAFIIADSKAAEKGSTDHVALVSDWFNRETSSIQKFTIFDQEEYINGYEDKQHCFKMTRDATGSKVGMWPWHSAVVNGRGWHDMKQLKSLLAKGKQLPLETFKVSSTAKNKIRLISASFVFPLMVSVEGHKLTVVAIDGRDIEPVTVDYVTTVQGERYDVILEPTEPIDKSAFLLKAQSVEKFDYFGNESTELDDHFVLAFLQYDGSTSAPKTILSRDCTTKKPCTVLNCLFEEYPLKFNSRKCIKLTDLKSKEDPPKEVLDYNPANFEQYFLNLYAAEPGYTINGIFHLMPTAPLFMNPNAYTKCDSECGKKKKCKCTNIFRISKGSMIELVLYNMIDDVHEMKEFGFGHQFHTHGHHFYVVETGFPKYAVKDGKFDESNMATTCDNWMCNYAQWNETIKRHGTKNTRPVIKDTVYVPVGGYVVVRLIADNPGYWLAHCHQGPHHNFGMAFIMKVGDDTHFLQPPDDFPVCGITMKDIRPLTNM